MNKIKDFYTSKKGLIAVIGVTVLIVLVLIIALPAAVTSYNTGIYIPNSVPQEQKMDYINRHNEILKISDQATMYNEIGLLRSALKDYQGAIRAFQLSLEIRPKDGKVIRNTALMYQYAGDYDMAEKTFRKALISSPNNPEYWLDLGDMLSYQLKDNAKAKAKAFYEMALQRSNNNVQVEQAYGSFLERTGDYAGAIKYYQNVADKVPDSRVAFLKKIEELKAKLQK